VTRLANGAELARVGGASGGAEHAAIELAAQPRGGAANRELCRWLAEEVLGLRR
jgi:uncharacterized protein YggU (UPF0235/DUF167 family)